MEIDFCDRCGSSIPRADLDRRAAGLRGGRLLCAACTAAERRRTVARAVLLPLGLVLAVGAGATAAVLVLSPRIRVLEARIENSGSRTPEAAPREDSAAIEGLRAIMREQSAAIQGLSDRLEKDYAAVAAAFEKLSEANDAIAAELRAVKEHLRPAGGAEHVPAAPPPAAPSTAPAPEGPRSEPAAPDLGTWLPLLDDEDAGVRLSALIAIEDSKDDRAKERTRALLTDPDPLVRAQAARMEGKWRDRAALPDLVRLLSDENVRVRAVSEQAITAIAGPVPGYDPTDPEEAREAAIRAFRERLK